MSNRHFVYTASGAGVAILIDNFLQIAGIVVEDPNMAVLLGAVFGLALSLSDQ